MAMITTTSIMNIEQVRNNKINLISEDKALELLNEVKPIIMAKWEGKIITGTKQVAEFYDVTESRMRSLLSENKEVFTLDEVFNTTALKRGERMPLVNTVSIKTNTRQMTIWTPKAILRAGNIIKRSDEAELIKLILDELEVEIPKQLKVVNINNKSENKIQQVIKEEPVQKLNTVNQIDGLINDLLDTKKLVLEIQELKDKYNLVCKEQENQSKVILELNNKLKSYDDTINSILKKNVNYYTIKEYAKKSGVNITLNKSQELGKEATKISKNKGYEIKRITDPVYGYVNRYSENVLKLLSFV